MRIKQKYNKELSKASKSDSTQIQKSSKMRLTDFLICLIPGLMILSASKNLSIPTAVIYALYILIIISDIIIERKIIFIKSIKQLFISILLAYLLIPLIIGHITTKDALLYVIIMICFIYVINITARRLSYDINSKILKGWLIVSLITLIPFVIINLNDININTIQNIFRSSTNRTRAYFGMNNPNTTALIVSPLIVLIFTIIKKDKIIIANIIKYAIVSLFLFIILLCTGSRTGIYTLVIYFASYFGLTIISKIKGKKMRIVIYMLLAIIMLFSMTRINIDSITSDSSDRDVRITKNIKMMQSQGLILLGTGATNISDMEQNLSEYGIKAENNSYYNILARFGIIGLIIVLAAIIIVTVESIKIIRIPPMYAMPLSIILYVLSYGMAEDALITQALPISIICWSIVYSTVYSTQQRKKDESFVLNK